MLGGAVVTYCFSRFGVNGTFPLGFPIKCTSCVAHFVIDITGSADALGNIRRMSRYTACDDALLNVVEIRESKMLGRSYIAEESGAKGRSCRPVIK